MTTDPMLAKAAALEAELLGADAHHVAGNARLMRQAALLIQQLRVRLEGENR